MSGPQKISALRLKPGDDLKKSLAAFVKDHNICAGYIITAVGSLAACNLRYAGQTAGTVINNKFEILSLSGTLSIDGLHLHISLADENGRTTGGHLLDGNVIYTTAEIIIGEATQLFFTRAHEPSTGYPELIINQR